MKAGLYLIGFAALMLFETLGHFGFKFVADRTAPVAFDGPFFARLLTEPWAAVLAVAFIATFLTYMMLLRDAPVGPLFAASHLDIVAVAIISIPVLGERLTALQFAGCAAIVAGVLLLAISEGRAAVLTGKASRSELSK